MLVTLIPLFDREMAVNAYSVFCQKENPFLNPLSMMSGQNDAPTDIAGLDLIRTMGLETLSDTSEIFIPVSNVSVFTDMDQLTVGIPHERIVFLIDNSFPPIDMYVNRLKELKDARYKLAIRGLAVADLMTFAPILTNVDYVLLNNKKIVIEKAKIFFAKLYPNIKLIAGNIEDQDTFDHLVETGGYDLYEGDFYRVPVTKGVHEVAPVKMNYLELLRTVNDADFELQDVADIIGRDPALTIDLLKMVNRVVKTAEITTIRHAAAMLGQRELKKWITTVVSEELYSDKPSEVTRLSLLRARFAENLADAFGLKLHQEELFMMGLFSVLDVILEKPMAEALDMIQVGGAIRSALVDHEGDLATILDFILAYESADWAAVSKTLLLRKVDIDPIYEAYKESLTWYRMTTVG